MNVGDLIERLKEFPPELIVYDLGWNGWNSEWSELTEINETENAPVPGIWFDW
jgi:hypothetical protein